MGWIKNRMCHIMAYKARYIVLESGRQASAVNVKEGLMLNKV